MNREQVNKLLDRLLAITNIALLTAFAAVLFGDSYFWSVMAAVVRAKLGVSGE